MNNEKLTLLGHNTVWITALVVTLVVMLTLLFFIRAKNRKTLNSKRLEYILNSLRKDEVKSIIIPDGIGGLLEVERLILMEQGILIIETYSMAGHLFGADKIDQWTQIINGRSFKFANPVHQIHNTKYAIQALAPKLPVFCRVVFTENSNFPKGKPSEVSNIATLEQDLMPLKQAANMTEMSNLAWERIMKVARQNGQAVLREGAA